jgi:hypothetical protein
VSSAILRWKPTIFDSIIPISIGIIELPLPNHHA